MMRISMKTDYGLIALKHMAAQQGDGLVNAKELAARFQLPPNLLAKILQSLSQSGIIEAQKGSGGGYRLVRNPADITLTEIFESIEGPVHMIMCTSDNGNCSVEDSCTIRNGLVSLESKFAEFFDSITLSDV
jgi:Rrf2 family protein